MEHQLKLLNGNAHPEFARNIARLLDTQLGHCEVCSLLHSINNKPFKKSLARIINTYKKQFITYYL